MRVIPPPLFPDDSIAPAFSTSTIPLRLEALRLFGGSTAGALVAEPSSTPLLDVTVSGPVGFNDAWGAYPSGKRQGVSSSGNSTYLAFTMQAM